MPNASTTWIARMMVFWPKNSVMPHGTSMPSAGAISSAGAGSGTAVIGEPRYNHRQEYPNTARNRDRLVPARLGRTFADEYLRQRGSP